MASGRPDWFGTIVAAGKYDTTFMPIALDVSGFITAKIKGAYDAVLKTIAVDSDGTMRANLAVQDLERITMRVSMGTPTIAGLAHIFGETGSHELVNIQGKGTILGGALSHTDTVSHKMCSINLEVDGVSFGFFTYADLKATSAPDYFAAPLRLVRYDDEIQFHYVAAFNPGWTFDTSLKVTFTENIGASETGGYIFYTLV